LKHPCLVHFDEKAPPAPSVGDVRVSESGPDDVCPALARGAGAWIGTRFDRIAHTRAPVSPSLAHETPEVRIVRLAAGDVQLARELAADVLGARSVPRASLLRLLDDDRSIVLVALRGRTPVGCLVAFRFPTLAGECVVELHELQVRAAERGTGIGRGLLSSLKAVCRADGADAIWVQSGLDNTAARSLWLAAGAEPVPGRHSQFIFALHEGRST
jgi:GNAT superfamily N-acetyltransferase